MTTLEPLAVAGQPDLKWQSLSACAGAADPQVFSPESHSRILQEQAADEAAAAFCRGCAVVAACREFADAGQFVGVWAGQLRRLRGADYTVTDLPSMASAVGAA